MITTLDSWPGLTTEGVEEIRKWLGIIKSESELEQPGHYHYLNDLNKELGKPVKKELLLETLGKRGSAVHYDGNAIKTSVTIKEMKKIF